jgi:membrane-associated protein
VRTYAPFVAGLGGMKLSTFLLFSVSGGLLWIGSFTSLGYFFGNIPAVKSNFQYVILAIIAVSVMPVAYEFFRHRKSVA